MPTEVIEHRAAASATPRRLTTVRGQQDILFRAAARSGGLTVLTIMTLVGVFLFVRGFDAITDAGTAFITTEAWSPNEGNFGIAAVLFGTVTIATIAIVLAVPLSIGTALYISEFAPRGLKRSLITIVDLMAAVPSVVYGLWGFLWLTDAILPIAEWISTHFGWIPIFDVDGFEPGDPLSTTTVFTASAFIAGIVVGLMVTPIASSIMREAFSQAPVGEREGALALGATRWGMVTAVVLPFGRGGIIGGTMLGLGRALGETIAVYLVISPVFVIQPNILQTGTNSISSLVALRFNEASEFELSALMAAGLALFLMTLVINFGASMVIARSRSGAESEG
ncbi:phosphate ABC transporter permease subunit PstC [Aeromicrobium alkaliterrae]|uniref:Phosphate transport system permease protein n=1 Tax=Aeromicrobium alkaliterrae TaxID=302168 RepID=A0ABN2JYC8_9ACTN